MDSSAMNAMVPVPDASVMIVSPSRTIVPTGEDIAVQPRHIVNEPHFSVIVPISASSVVLVPHIALPVASTPTHTWLIGPMLQSLFWRYPLAVIPLSFSVFFALPSVLKRS